MALANSDLCFYASSNGNQGGPIGAKLVNNVLPYGDAFSGAETAAGGPFYCCVYAKNDSTTNIALQPTKVFFAALGSHPGITVQMGLGAAPVNNDEANNAGGETFAPSGVVFQNAEGEGNALDIGANVPIGGRKAVWIEVTIAPGTAAVDDFLMRLAFSADSSQ